MAQVLMQRDLEVPDVEKLARAFRVLPELTGLDAQTAANDAYGILLRGLDTEKAGRLRAALLEEGIETEIVPDTTLPSLPSGRLVKRVELTEQSLRVQDPLGRVVPVSWNQIALIASGKVRVRETCKVRTTLEEPLSHPAGIAYDTLNDVRTRESENEHLMLELFLTGDGSRFSFAMDEFVFDRMGEQFSEDPVLNFMFLVKDLERNAPDASLNRGAFFACQTPPHLFTYPSKPAFNEELIWMLWRIEQLGLSRE
jgi:hypothetical protein